MLYDVFATFLSMHVKHKIALFCQMPSCRNKFSNLLELYLRVLLDLKNLTRKFNDLH